LKGWHFLPASFPVPAIAGSNGTANFEGRKAAEITGRVTAPGGGPMSDVTVTAWSDAETSDSVYAVTTTTTGTFSVFVPTLSGTVWLDAKPRSGYTRSNPHYERLQAAEMYVWFDHPANRPDGSIAVIPGQVLQFGTFTGNSVQPRITSVKRGVVEADTATIPDGNDFQLVKGEPTNEIEVKWEYDTRNDDGATDDSYSVASDADITLGGVTDGSSTTLPTVSGDDSRQTERTGVADGTTVTHKRTTTHAIADADDASYGEIDVTVEVDVTGADGDVEADEATSASVELAAVASGVTNLKVDRDFGLNAAQTAEDTLTATWSGKGSPELEHRIALRVEVNPSEWAWLIFGEPSADNGAPTAQPDITRNVTPGSPAFGKWSSEAFDLNATASAGGSDEWEDDDDDALKYTVILANLRAATHLRIDTMVDGGDWVKQTPVAIPGG
jgi:hypothetical protein